MMDARVTQRRFITDTGYVILNDGVKHISCTDILLCVFFKLKNPTFKHPNFKYLNKFLILYEPHKL